MCIYSQYASYKHFYSIKLIIKHNNGLKDLQNSQIKVNVLKNRNPHITLKDIYQN